MSDTKLAIFALALDESHDELVNHMRGMKMARERGVEHIACLIGGFDNDSRELYDIPEVRAFCRRLVNLGLVSYLDFSTLWPHQQPLSASWGAAEVWLCGEGLMRKVTTLTMELLNQFRAELEKSNEKADATVGAPKFPS